MEHELPTVLDGSDEPVTVEELEGVVRRAGQRRRANLVAGAAALLAVGGLGGALARGPGDAGTTGGYAGGRDDSETAATLPAAGSGSGYAMGGPDQELTPLFRREANGVAIRAYRATWNVPEGSVKSPCGPPDSINGELSNGAAVTFAMAFTSASTKSAEAPAGPLAVLAVGAFGRAEGEEATWVVAEATAPVATVRVTVGATSDTMAPTDGIAILAVPATGAAPVVEGLGADGKVVATEPAVEEQMPSMPMDTACFPPPCVSGGPATTLAEESPEQLETRKKLEAQIGGAPASGTPTTAADHVIIDGHLCDPIDMAPPPSRVPGSPPAANEPTADPPAPLRVAPPSTTAMRPTSTAPTRPTAQTSTTAATAAP